MCRPILPLLVAMLTAMLPAPPARSDEPPAVVEFSSGERRVSLLELYTSEGCSSCPPADRWLRGLEDNDGLWRDFVPLALHVDYWDYIGWRDRFAQAEFADRQRRYAREGGSRSVYTPGMFVDGREWLGWRRAELPPRGDEPAGDLTLQVLGDTIDVRYVGGAPVPERLRVHVGLLGMNVATEVRAGENRGRRLEHDFVLLDLASTALAESEGVFAASASVAVDAAAADRVALIAWVSRVDRQAPLQAVGGFLPER